MLDVAIGSSGSHPNHPQEPQHRSLQRVKAVVGMKIPESEIMEELHGEALHRAPDLCVLRRNFVLASVLSEVAQHSAVAA